MQELIDYKFRLNIIYTLKDATIDITWKVKNIDDKEICFGLGGHPAYACEYSSGKYRLEFEDGTTRLIKSCNRCEPVIVNTGDGYPKSTRYNLTDSSSDFVFCTVSPSSSPTFKPNAKPYIGEPGKEVKLINTFFTPQMYVIEMVTHDMDTLSYMLEGDQTNDRDNAIITTYNDKHEIYHQSDYYVLKDRLGNPLYTVRKRREIIDTNQSYDNIIDNG